ncbi:MAG TPA: hypothetical protein VFE24_00785 [Pirellulales bacterium]|jgi:hypothetical protein|nr:hypothetical protein [Pirellulales bacterium]
MKRGGISRQTVRFALGFCGGIIACGLLGCRGDSDVNKPVEHHHPEHGPHQGMLVELGEKDAYHLEIATDPAAHRFSVYVLDGNAAKSVSVEQKELLIKVVDGDRHSEFKVPAAPQPGDAAGQTSRFEIVSPELCALFDKPGVDGHFNITIDQIYIATFKGGAHEEPDEHHL